MHEVLVNRLGGLSLPRKSVVRLTDRPDMTLDVYRGRKTTMQQRFKIIIRHKTELKWITLLLTPYQLGFNDNIYHEGNLSKMPDFDVFFLLEFRKRTARSHGIKKNGNCKRKDRVQKLANCTLRDLATKLDVHGRHCISRKENPQKPTQLSSRSHPRHLVGKRTAQKTPS